MTTPSPLIPQGSLLEQKAKARPHLRVFVVIVAVHLVFLGGLLMQGCKKDDTLTNRDLSTDTNAIPPVTDLTNLYPTNLTSPVDTNLAGGGYPMPVPSQPLTGGGMGGGLTPPTPEPIPTPVAPSTTEYTIARGDTFSSISRKFGVTVPAISKANPGVDSSKLRVGQKIQIPAASSQGATTHSAPAGASGSAGTTSDSVYVVKKGDTLSKIARTHGTTVPALKDVNGLKNDRIHEGQKLRLPAKASTATPAPAPEPATPPPAYTAPAPAPTGTPSVVR